MYVCRGPGERTPDGMKPTTGFPEDVMVWGGISAHAKTQLFIHSHDLNIIEQGWAWMKMRVSELQSQTMEDLSECLISICDSNNQAPIMITNAL